MNRIFLFEHQGVKYPLNFSVLAASKVYEKFGNMQGMQEAVGGDFSEKSIAEVLWIFELLMDQGIAYELYENQMEHEKMNFDNLSVRLSVGEFNLMKAAIYKTVSLGLQTTIDVKPPKKKDASSVATQAKHLSGSGFMGRLWGLGKGN